MRKALLPVMVAMLLLGGCGSRKATTVERITDPLVGSVATRGVGEPLISSGLGVFRSDIDLDHDARVGDHKIPAGIYAYYDENSTGIWFSSNDQYFFIKKSDDTVCIDGKGCAKLPYKFVKRPAFTVSDSLQQTLLYNGRIGSRVTIAYREFSNNMARPAFNNNVEYDLNESMIVGYKGARLEIVKATNTEITYRVLSGFAPAEIR